MQAESPLEFFCWALVFILEDVEFQCEQIENLFEKSLAH